MQLYKHNIFYCIDENILQLLNNNPIQLQLHEPIHTPHQIVYNISVEREQRYEAYRATSDEDANKSHICLLRSAGNECYRHLSHYNAIETTAAVNNVETLSNRNFIDRTSKYSNAQFYYETCKMYNNYTLGLNKSSLRVRYRRFTQQNAIFSARL